LSDSVLRLCLDSHLLVGNVISSRLRLGQMPEARRIRYPVGRYLLEIASAGCVEAVGVQLILSTAMLKEVTDALVLCGVNRPAAEALAEGYAAIARLGPRAESARQVQGGIGVLRPGESGTGVLEAAVAGRAHVLATDRVPDFLSPSDTVLEVGGVAIRKGEDCDLVIARPRNVAGLLRAGIFPDAEAIRDPRLSSPRA
jgi:hypothetical protein